MYFPTSKQVDHSIANAEQYHRDLDLTEWFSELKEVTGAVITTGTTLKSHISANYYWLRSKVGYRTPPERERGR